MGGDYGANAPKTDNKLLEGFARYLPQILGITSAQTMQTAQDQLAAAQATQPGFNALNLQQTQQFAPQLAQVGSDIQRQNALAGAETNRLQLEGPGRAAANAANVTAREANPNFYRVQDAASNQAVNLLNSINLNGLSPGEANAIERSTNQTNTATGNLGLMNPNNTIANAMNFGGAYNNKLGILGNALGAANNTASSAQNTGFNPVNIALGQPSPGTAGNFGTSTFSPTNSSTGDNFAGNAFGFGSDLLNAMFGINTAREEGATSRSNTNSIPGYMSSLPT